MTEQNRFRSPVLWASVVAQILSLLVVIGVIDTGLSEAIEGVMIAVLELLVAFGILNNPRDPSAL